MAIGQKAIIPEGFEIMLNRRGYIEAENGRALKRKGCSPAAT